MKTNQKTDFSPQLRGLYAIADTHLLGKRLPHAIEAALEGGAKIIQYRDKTNNAELRLTQAKTLRSLCSDHNATLIINDDIELANECNADGVHLGKNDCSFQEAREKLGKKAIIGVSCYNQLTIAKDSAKHGADYIAFGSIYPSNTKPSAVHAPMELFSQAKSLNIPCCAIGGITAYNAQNVIDAGADMIAIISALFNTNDIQHTTRQFVSFFQ